MYIAYEYLSNKYIYIFYFYSIYGIINHIKSIFYVSISLESQNGTCSVSPYKIPTLSVRNLEVDFCFLASEFLIFLKKRIVIDKNFGMTNDV